MKQSRRWLWVSLGVMILLNLSQLWTNFTMHNWDSQGHIFHASHYLAAWFSPWEEKWYSGFWVFSYPPLVHQLIAVFSYLGGLEVAYRLVQAAFMLLFPVATWLLGKELLGEPAASIAALLSPVLAGMYVILYTFGQLPSFASFVLALLAGYFLARYQKSGRFFDLAGWFTLCGATVAAHHHTIIFLATLSVVVVLTIWIKEWNRRKPVRACIAVVTFALAAGITILPFWWWYFTKQVTQTSIPHPTRESFLANEKYARMFFWDMYGGMLFLIPVGLVATIKKRQLYPLWVGFIFLGLLGLGGVTDFPRLVFGSFWEVLTYERFAFWAAALSIFPVSAGLAQLPNKGVIKAAIVLVMVFGVSRAIVFQNRDDLLPKPLDSWEETEIVKFLDEHTGWRYVTFGLGEPEMVRISRLTRAQTVDGFFYQARWKEVEAISGSGTLDSSPWLVEESYPLLFPMLQHPWDWNLRWAIVKHPWIIEHLQNSGWKLLHPIGKDNTFQLDDSFSSLVTVWEAPTDADFMSKVESSMPPSPKVLSYWWGIVPLSVLLTSLLLLAFSLKREEHSS